MLRHPRNIRPKTPFFMGKIKNAQMRRKSSWRIAPMPYFRSFTPCTMLRNAWARFSSWSWVQTKLFKKRQRPKNERGGSSSNIGRDSENVGANRLGDRKCTKRCTIILGQWEQVLYSNIFPVAEDMVLQVPKIATTATLLIHLLGTRGNRHLLRQ